MEIIKTIILFFAIFFTYQMVFKTIQAVVKELTVYVWEMFVSAMLWSILYYLS